jgi:hypothetical protein
VEESQRVERNDVKEFESQEIEEKLQIIHYLAVMAIVCAILKAFRSNSIKHLVRVNNANNAKRLARIQG